MTESTTRRKIAKTPSKGRGTPPPADYSDGVTDEQIKRLKELVSDLGLEDWEKVSGPAW